jgi:DNA-binding winged helix-turn-helix (wHTH) protein
VHAGRTFPDVSRFRFGEFTLLPRRRLLLRSGVAVPLIPKYFDLLQLLVERRHEALDRREIFDRIWADVVVTDGALTQAVRTLRRVLQDDPRAPQYIRTVSRHGYQFVFEPVIVDSDDAPPATEAVRPAPVESGRESEAEYTRLIARLLATEAHAGASDDDRREAAERLHVLGTGAALERLDAAPGHAEARAILRDARWDVPGAGEVPLLGAPDPVASVAALVKLRVRGAVRAALRRLGTAAAGGAIAGIVAGMIGGTSLMLAGDGPASVSVPLALMIIAGLAGAFGAAGIGAGLAAAEVLARARRRLGLAICGALSGMTAALLASLALRAVFGSVVGRPPAAIGGPFEGLLIGFAAGLGYGWATPTPRGGGMATPHGPARIRAALATAVCCALAGALLGAAGARTVSVTLDNIAETYAGSQVGLGPLARLIGEQDARPMTRSLVSALEGLFFGFGLAFGLTHRPSGRSSA